VTPAAEIAYLRRLADEIAADTRLGPIARVVTAAILLGRAERIDRKEHP